MINSLKKDYKFRSPRENQTEQDLKESKREKRFDLIDQIFPTRIRISTKRRKTEKK